MDYVLTENHRTEFPNPLILQKGENVIVGNKSSPEWPDWVFCEKTDGSNSGWVPKNIINVIIPQGANRGFITENYTARELDIDKGALVEALKEFGGWCFVRNKTSNEEGWVPKKILSEI